MADPWKILYMVVVDDREKENSSSLSFRYTRSLLQSTLQFMGCKARHAFKVFDAMRSECSSGELSSLESKLLISNRSEKLSDSESDDEETHHLTDENEGTLNSMPFEIYKRLTTVVVARETFLNVVCNALSAYKYIGSNQRDDLIMACRIRERKESVTVLLCGTSGCGKSTLSSLLGSRLGITTVISTDSIRHMMRSFVDEKQNPLLWASTYHAGEYLDTVAVAEAKAKRKAQKLAGIVRLRLNEDSLDGASNRNNCNQPLDGGLSTEYVGKKQMAIEGFKAQSEMVIESLDRLITAWEETKESVIVEGVHLSLNFVMGLMKKHPSIIPFMIYIQNENKHMERFAIRAKYMTLDPAKNKYVKYMRNIRTIQDYLCSRADKHLVPKVSNTNVDRSVAAIHATVFSCLRRREAGEKLYDPITTTVPIMYEEYRNQCAANSLSSKGMFQLIQRQGSSRYLMALLNTDGSVAKVWPVKSDDDGKAISNNAMESCANKPMYGPLEIWKTQPVNLQFGNFGIGAWPSDTGGASHNGNLDDSWVDGNDNGSRYFPSSCISPRISEGTAKEPMEELSVSGSEEADDPAGVDSDEDQSDVEEGMHEEMEGSVDEEATKSDEEYDDLAMRDGLENGCWSDEAAGVDNVKATTDEKPM